MELLLFYHKQEIIRFSKYRQQLYGELTLKFIQAMLMWTVLVKYSNVSLIQLGLKTVIQARKTVNYVSSFRDTVAGILDTSKNLLIRGT